MLLLKRLRQRLQRWFSPAASQCRHAGRNPNRARPRLEALEDRLVLSSFHHWGALLALYARFTHEANHTAAVAAPSSGSDIVMNSVKLADKKDLVFHYTINNASVGQPFNVAIYRATTNQFNPGDPHFAADYQQLANVTVPASQATVGTQESITVPLPNGLPPEPSHPYVLAVANPSDQVQEASTANDVASFRVYSVAVVVPGFSYRAWQPPPTWALSMDAALYRSGYNRVVNFMWNSGTILNPWSWNPTYLYQAEVRLAQEVKWVAGRFPANSVVDVNLIGHSRGAEVVAGASSLLATTSVPQLQDGYLEVTLLDPHPNSNAYSPNESINPSPLGQLAGKVYHLIQQVMSDPPLVIPPNVNYVSEYYQHTLWSQFPLFNEEHFLNVWGLAPAQIIYNPSDTVFANQELLPPPIGHSQVQGWYTNYIVPQLAYGPA